MTNQPKPKRTRSRIFTLTLITPLAASGAIALAACGGGGQSTAGNGMAGMAMAAHPGGNNASAPVATDTIDIKNFAFSPATITVAAGSTVTWTNKDDIQHDITFDGGSVKSSTLNHNDTFSHTFATAGTYHYICSIHPFMHGTVIVTR